MSYHQSLNSFFTNELTVKRNGFWRPVYELMGGQYSYGTLRHEGVWKPKVIIETAEHHWIIQGMGWKKGEITNPKGELVATVTRNFWDTKVTFTTHDGFTATFEKPSVWKSHTVWRTADGAELLSFNPQFFSPDIININQKAKPNSWLLLLAFLALEIHLSRQKRAAAAT
jgi:hypothetical protein